MNKAAEPNDINSNILLDINKKLLTYNSIILYQKEEILKTEALIKQYTDHLDRQNEVLKVYLEEEDELKKKKKEIIKDNECQHNTKNIIEDVQMFQKEYINEVKIFETPTEINVVNKIEKNITQSKKSSQHLDKKIKIHKKNMSTINITKINKETVYSMSVYKNNIFIAGSNGMLVKQFSIERFIYETNTKEDILQLEIINNRNIISLIAFTKGTVIIFKNSEQPHIYRHIYLPGIEHVFRKNNNYLYIPVTGGIIHKLNIVNISIKQLKLPNNECVSSIATGFTNKDFTLAVFKNGLLYKCEVTDNSINNFEHVKGVQDLKRVFRILNLGYVYYSDTTIWIVDNKLNELKNEKFENGIKLVEVCINQLFVVDHDDTLHIYTEAKKTIKKCYCQRIMGNITAMTVYKDKVYLSVGNEIFIIKFK